MASVFTRIISGEIPSYKIAEDDRFFAFLDISPLAKGHTLVVPKQETDYIFDIEDAQHKDLWDFAKRVAKAVKSAVPCKRIGIAVIGLEVPHAHIHLIPMNKVSDMNFASPKLSFPPDEMEEIAQKIRSQFI
ncbi:MAG: HIT family protein [Bacteroidetes bacterium]|nr:HIT family protein [Bacteroidota bacterium]MBL0137792.1 HIT family protein [Bacteroidota bacterium]